MAQPCTCSRLQTVILAFLILWLGYLAYLAVIIQVNHFDTYSVLNNARLIMRGGDYPYELIRPPLLSVLMSTLYIFKWDEMMHVIIAGRLFAVAVFAAYLFLAYKIFRLHLESAYAWLGVFLVSLNPVLLANAPLCREDILGAFLAAGTFYAYTLWRHQRSHPLWVSLFLTLAALSRHNLGPMLFMILMLLEIRHDFKSKEAWRQRLLYLVVVPGSVFFLVCSLLYWRIGLTPLWRAPIFIVQHLWWYFGFLQKQADLFPSTPMEVVDFLRHAYSWPLLVLAVLGAASAIFRRRDGLVLHGIWAAFFLVFHLFILKNDEARYLIVFFIPLYFFILIALEELNKFLVKQREGKNSGLLLARGALIFLMLILPVQMALRGLARFQDPVYRTDFERRISLLAQAAAGKEPVFWIGRFYALHPKDYVFHLQDELQFIYHFYANVVRFFIQEEVIDYHAPVVFDRGVLFLPGIMPYISHDAVLIVNPEPADYATNSIPATMKPLIMAKAKIYAFRKTAAGYVCADLPEAQLNLIEESGQPKLSATRLPRGDFEIYTLETDGQFQSKGLFSSGKEDVNLYDLAADLKETSEIKILMLSDIRLFEAP